MTLGLGDGKHCLALEGLGPGGAQRIQTQSSQEEIERCRVWRICRKDSDTVLKVTSSEEESRVKLQ
jgi:hypothetical protein